MSKVDDISLTTIFRYIRQGYSESFFDAGGLSFSGKKIYIKHLGALDIAKSDELKEREMFLIKQKGVPEEKERLEQVIKEGLWGEEKEEEIAKLKENIKLVSQTRDKANLLHEKEKYQNIINAYIEKFNKIYRERESLIGDTVETLIEERVNIFNSQQALFLNKNLTENALSGSELDYLSQEQFEAIKTFYVKELGKISITNIRKLAIQSFFQDIWSVADNNVYSFFGKFAADLSFPQVDLVKHAQLFKEIIREGIQKGWSDEILSDPDKLLTNYSVSKKSEEMRNKTKSANPNMNFRLVGETEEDRAARGETSVKQTPHEILTKKFGNKKSFSLADAAKAGINFGV